MMAKKPKKLTIIERNKTVGSQKPPYVFQPASEMPRIKWAYVVQSPTPLGHHAVRREEDSEKRK